MLMSPCGRTYQSPQMIRVRGIRHRSVLGESDYVNRGVDSVAKRRMSMGGGITRAGGDGVNHRARVGMAARRGQPPLSHTACWKEKSPSAERSTGH